MKRLGRGTLIPLVACLAGVLAPASAEAVVKIPSTVNITAAVPEEASWAIAGNVRSNRPKCRAGRRLRLVEVGVGVVDSGVSTPRGLWELNLPALEADYGAGVYRAIALPKRFRRNGHARYCRPDGAPLSLELFARAITISFEPESDVFSGAVDSPNETCDSGPWTLFYSPEGSGFNEVNQGVYTLGSWAYDYGSDPPGGLYTVTARVTTFGGPTDGGGFSVGICDDDSASTTVLTG